MTRITRRAYADMYGPTVGDRVRLADTDLLAEVERDLTTYGEEVKFGGGKVIRDGMGQSQTGRDGGTMDTVITNALILDHTGIYKADVGLRDGRIAAPMTGLVRAVPAMAGARVAPGDILVVIEAMKMEHSLRAADAGTVQAIHCAVGDTVADGALLVELEPADG